MMDDEINKNFIQIFDKSIFIIGQDEHQTSLVFLIESDNLYILSINSGLGLENHKACKRYNSPYYCFKINIKDIIESLNPSLDRTLDKTKSKHNHIYKIGCLLMFNKFYTEIKKFITEEKDMTETDIKKKMTETDIKKMAENIGIGNEINGLFVADKNQTIKNIKNYVIQPFYKLFIEYANKYLDLEDATDDFNNILISKISKDKDKLSDESTFEINQDEDIHKRLNERLYLKHRLYLLNNNGTEGIYIHAQENGSCTFYSLYWSILITTLFKDSYEDYIKMIHLFEDRMVHVFQDIYKDHINVINKVNLNYSVTSTILNKLCNLNILSKTEADIHDNYLYQREFLFTKSKQVDKTLILSDEFRNGFESNYALEVTLIPNLKQGTLKNINNALLCLYYSFTNYPDIYIIPSTPPTPPPDIYSINKDEVVTKEKFIQILNQIIKNEMHQNEKTFYDYSTKYYSSELLNIYSVQYYYIAKSIVQFCSKHNLINDDNNIIKFCNFIHKFYLFEKYFEYKLIEKVYELNKDKIISKLIENYLIKLNDSDIDSDSYSYISEPFSLSNIKKSYYVNCCRILESSRDTKTNKHLIDDTLKELIIVQDPIKLVETESFWYERIGNRIMQQIIDSLTLKNHLSKNFTYSHGFTINFNFDIFHNNDKDEYKDMFYPQEQLESMTKFLYQNPKYLYWDFNSNYFFNFNYFVETNIIEILKNTQYKNTLDKFYRDLFYTAVKTKKPQEQIDYFGKKILLLNNCSLKSNTYDFKRHSLSKEKEIELINELIKYTSKNYIEFMSFTLEYNDIESIFKKYKLEPTDFTYCDMVDEFELLFNTNNAHVFFKNSNEIYIFYENYYLVIKYEVGTLSDKIKISNILVNGEYKVIKRESIIFPFKYFIPSACVSLIYQVGNNYNVLCIGSKFNEDEYKVLFGELQTKDFLSTLNYQVDPSNLTTLIIDKNINQIEKLNSFIANYGINNLNYIYFKYWDSYKPNSPDEIRKHYGNQLISKHDFNLLCLFNTKQQSSLKPIDKFINKDTSLIPYLISLVNRQEYINFSLIKLHKSIDSFDFTLENTLDHHDEKIIYLAKLNEIKSTEESLDKLIFKLSACEIDQSPVKENLVKFNKLIQENFLKSNEKIITDILDNKPIMDLIMDPINIINHTTLLKLGNICNELIADMDKQITNEALCSKLKIIQNMLEVRKYNFIYAFEFLFEYILGINVLNEQFNKYVNIINHYNSENYIPTMKSYQSTDTNIFNVRGNITFKDIMRGGGYTNYPLHHIMMGKGKSTVLTPLLSLYFSLVEKKKVFIIVPPHLLAQTNSGLSNIIKIFELENQIIIKSDKDIKLEYLEQKLNYKNSIFLIDEFDFILDPLKSNFNLTIKDFKMDNSIKNCYLKSIIQNYINPVFNIKNDNNIDEIICELNKIYKSSKKPLNQHIINEIINVLMNIKKNILKYNINWGIHPEKGYAIPYMNKDTPLFDSNFNSIILTLVLTYYYYHLNTSIVFDDNLVSTFIYYKLQSEVVEYCKKELPIDHILIKEELNKLDLNIRSHLLFKIILLKIIDSIEMSDY